jgi:hypothetical protein
VGEMYIAPIPHCPTHGQMSHHVGLAAWICHGFDGEGCDYTVREQDMGWILVDETEGEMRIEFA